MNMGFPSERIFPAKSEIFLKFGPQGENLCICASRGEFMPKLIFPAESEFFFFLKFGPRGESLCICASRDEFMPK